LKELNLEQKSSTRKERKGIDEDYLFAVLCTKGFKLKRQRVSLFGLCFITGTSKEIPWNLGAGVCARSCRQRYIL